MKANQKFQKLATDERAELNITFGLTIIGVIIGAVVAIAIVAALFPTYMTSLSDLGTAFNDPNTTTGDDSADALLPIFGLLIAFAGLFAIVGIVLLAVKLKKGA